MIWVESRLSESLVMIERTGPCWVCGGPTNTIDIDFEAHQHSGWCSQKAERDYWEAVHGE